MPFTASDICKIIFAIILPPLGVFLERGCGADLLINILLTILGWLPGIIHALYVSTPLPLGGAMRRDLMLTLNPVTLFSNIEAVDDLPVHLPRCLAGRSPPKKLHDSTQPYYRLPHTLRLSDLLLHS
ncbi:plasma membrane proteolipid 3 [Penicillium diatomitis]|uniref:Plasma membrane proteolipid 3 n=1 Tax=Penicillium diatomitis TaxID=2819901 RepID=A0A9W9XIH6_9EURO|nr:plasma membrane proteolipid 3 [Penicillium diatomitis]KAJ5493230.1 plasma membrane proteolipid 3 [Penicillium diatomitis]